MKHKIERVFITGANGFIGQAVAAFLNKKGIGKATVKKLIDYFGTFEAIENASYDDLEKVTNKKISNIIKNYNP